MTGEVSPTPSNPSGAFVPLRSDWSSLRLLFYAKTLVCLLATSTP
jgi:hypothetical protein